MNNSKANKKQQILAIVMGTCGIIVVLHMFLIDFLNSSLEAAEDKIAKAETNYKKHRSIVAKRDAIQLMMDSLSEEMASAEDSLPKGDVYLWMLKNIESFGAEAKVEFNQIEPPRAGESDSIPTLSYPMAIFTISGNAFYQDFGTFLADFENKFPYIRLRSLEMEPAAFGRPGDEQKEKLHFKIEFMTPVKPSDQKDETQPKR